MIAAEGLVAGHRDACGHFDEHVLVALEVALRRRAAQVVRVRRGAGFIQRDRGRQGAGAGHGEAGIGDLGPVEILLHLTADIHQITDSNATRSRTGEHEHAGRSLGRCRAGTLVRGLDEEAVAGDRGHHVVLRADQITHAIATGRCERRAQPGALDFVDLVDRMVIVDDAAGRGDLSRLVAIGASEAAQRDGDGGIAVRRGIRYGLDCDQIRAGVAVVQRHRRCGAGAATTAVAVRVTAVSNLERYGLAAGDGRRVVDGEGQRIGRTRIIAFGHRNGGAVERHHRRGRLGRTGTRVQRAGAVAWCRSGRGEVGGVVVGVGAAVLIAQCCGRVGQLGHGAGTFIKSSRSVADQIDDQCLLGRRTRYAAGIGAAASEISGAVHQHDLAVGSRHGGAARCIRIGQGWEGGVATDCHFDQVVASGWNGGRRQLEIVVAAVREVAGGTAIAQGHAGQACWSIASIEQLDEVMAELRATVSATAVHLTNHHLRTHRLRAGAAVGYR